MRVGTLVRQEEYGTIGVITEILGKKNMLVYVSWLTTPNLDPLWYCFNLEVLCE